MRAIMGTGEEHVKWQPVSAAVVRGIPIFHVEEGKCDGCGLCIEECPKHIIKLDPKPIVTDLYACTTCMLCMRACPRGALLIDIDENSSIFMIESLGQLPPEKIVDQGLLQLTRSLDALDRLLDGLRMEGGEGGS
jgi:DNA-directed RNA polymerase subunit D